MHGNAPMMTGGTPSRGSILVVDDDTAIRETLMDVLEDDGYRVVGAENGKRALECLRGAGVCATRPMLVLLDLMMPVMSGWELLDHIHKDARLADIPVVVVSAMTAPGVQASLPKPVSLDELLRVVHRFAPR